MAMVGKEVRPAKLNCSQVTIRMESGAASRMSARVARKRVTCRPVDDPEVGGDASAAAYIACKDTTIIARGVRWRTGSSRCFASAGTGVDWFFAENLGKMAAVSPQDLQLKIDGFGFMEGSMGRFLGVGSWSSRALRFCGG